MVRGVVSACLCFVLPGQLMGHTLIIIIWLFQFNNVEFPNCFNTRWVYLLN